MHIRKIHLKHSKRIHLNHGKKLHIKHKVMHKHENKKEDMEDMHKEDMHKEGSGIRKNIFIRKFPDGPGRNQVLRNPSKNDGVIVDKMGGNIKHLSNELKNMNINFNKHRKKGSGLSKLKNNDNISFII